MKTKYNRIANDIMRCSQLAAAIEVSGWPKPGNVHRTADFHDTKFEHFIAGSIAIGPIIKKAAIKGIKVGLNKLIINNIGIGKLIKEAFNNLKEWHKGGNTHLGTLLLFIPLATAAGLTYTKDKKINTKKLRKNVKKVMIATTHIDTVHVFDAIISANSTALGRLERRDLPDLMSKEMKNRLLTHNNTLYDVIVASSKWDNISKEWASGMKICFEIGYPSIVKTYEDTRDINIAAVHSYLTIISKYPDTLIARKVGLKETPYIEKAVKIGIKKTRWISEEAERILKLGGLKTTVGSTALFTFDRRLRMGKGMLNPGTSADLTACSLMIAFLYGLRF